MACLKDDVEAALLHGRARDVVAVPQNLSVLDGEVDVVQNAVVRIRLADMLEFEYRAPLVNWPSSKRTPRVRAYTGAACMRGAGG